MCAQLTRDLFAIAKYLFETLLVSVGMGMGGNRDYFLGIWELEYSLRFPKAGNRNEVMGMGGNRYIDESHSGTSLVQIVYKFVGH